MQVRSTLFILLLFPFLSTLKLTAQTPDSIETVQLSARINEQAPSIQLNWFTLNAAEQYLVYKKLPAVNSFGPPVDTLEGEATSWVDSNIQVGQLYHYRLIRSGPPANGHGYITAGIRTHMEDMMGKILLVVDTNLITADHPSLIRYSEDLINEGWQPVLIPVSRDTTAEFVKSLIVQAWESDRKDARALVLIGHVPVPYAGVINPDGHNDHIGAWPADTYYADVDGRWTDFTARDVSASQQRNHNVPGDGKWDQSIIPFDSRGPDNYAELETGRIDFANLNTFSESELELLERYFDKNHAFRTHQIQSKPRGLIENNFRNFPEGFGQNGLRDFAAMFGPDSVFYRDYDNLKNEPYLWSYACGGGNYNGASGINNANSMAADSLQAIFSMHFGSYFGDWDNGSGNYLRAALGSGTILTNAWAGRPHWPNYYMAMGKNIGYVAKMAMNNPGDIHDSGFGNRWVHIALMGDPSLRMHVSDAPLSMQLNEVDSGVEIRWTPPAGARDGYFVYYRQDQEDAFQRLHSEMITDTFSFHACPQNKTQYEYMVRAADLQMTGSGSYYHLSPGIRDTLSLELQNEPIAAFSYSTSEDTLFLENQSTNADQFYWDFGDGTISQEEQPVHIYAASGQYEVSLIAGNGCTADTIRTIVEISLVSSEEAWDGISLDIYPNPASDLLTIEWGGEASSFRITDQSGRVLLKGRLQTGRQYIDLSSLASGIYFLQLEDKGKANSSGWKILKVNE